MVPYEDINVCCVVVYFLTSLVVFSLTLSATPAPFTLCRQCPSYTPPTHTTPSHPTPPPFTCTTTTNHVLCLCCLQPMPDRRNDSDMSIPPQKCTYTSPSTLSPKQPIIFLIVLSGKDYLAVQAHTQTLFVFTCVLEVLKLIFAYLYSFCTQNYNTHIGNYICR